MFLLERMPSTGKMVTTVIKKSVNIKPWFDLIKKKNMHQNQIYWAIFAVTLNFYQHKNTETKRKEKSKVANRISHSMARLCSFWLNSIFCCLRSLPSLLNILMFFKMEKKLIQHRISEKEFIGSYIEPRIRSRSAFMECGVPAEVYN